MRTKKAVIALLAGGIALVAGCSGSVTSGASSSSSLANGAAHAAGVPAAGVPAAGSAPSAASSGAASSGAALPPGTAATTGRLASSASIIYTAQLTVRAPNVSQAAASATRIAQEAGGYVSQE